MSARGLKNSPKCVMKEALVKEILVKESVWRA